MESAPISSLCPNLQLSKSDTQPHERIAAGSTFQSHEGLLRCLGGPLEFWELLAAVSVLPSLLSTASPGHSASFASLVNRDGMSSMMPAFGTVGVNLFWKLQL